MIAWKHRPTYGISERAGKMIKTVEKEPPKKKNKKKRKQNKTKQTNKKQNKANSVQDAIKTFLQDSQFFQTPVNS